MKILQKKTMLIAVGVLMSGVLTSCQKNNNAKPELPKPDDRSLKVNGISDGLIAYWPLDNNANDLSGNGNNGTPTNVSATTDRFGNTTGAYYFNGTSSYITVADQAPLRLSNTSFTLNAWVKPDAYNSSYNSAIIVKRLSGFNNGYLWGITANANNPVGVVFYGPGGGSTNAFGNTVVGTGSWKMVTSVYNLTNQQLSIYVNGVLDQTVSNISSANAQITTSLYIGRDDPSTGTNGYFFQGALDDIRIYNRAITTTEIQQLYSPTAPTNGLIAYWPLDNNANDLSGNGHHGTATNISATTNRFGTASGASSFNGSSSYITVPDQADLRLGNTSFTLNAWVKLDVYNSSYNSAIIVKRLSGFNNGYLWGITANANNPVGVVFYGPGGGSTNAFGSTVVGTGNWRMVTSVYNLTSQQLGIYVNGVLDQTVSNISSANAQITTSLYIGRDDPSTGTNGYFFQGSLDDIRIYNRAVSTTEVQQLYNASN